MKLIHCSLIIPALLIAFGALAEQPLTTDKDRLSYGLGMIIGERVLKQYGEVDYQILLQGIIAQHQGKQTQMSMTEAGQTLSRSQQKITQQKYEAVMETGTAYLAENAKLDGVTVTESGLQYSVITQADGARPTATDSVTVHYRGTLLDGTEFDSSYARDEPTTFPLNGVIPGWTEGVQLMSVGSKFKFVIPFQLAYGESGAGASIGPYETLIFEIELLSIN